MAISLGVFALAFALALGATWAARLAARRLDVVDRPDTFRKVHQRATPRLGGMAIYVAFAAALAVLWWLPWVGLSAALQGHWGKLLGLLLGGAVALVAGVVDDVRGLRPRWKLLLETVAAGVAVAAGCGIDRLASPSGAPVSLGVFAVPVSIVWFLACMNAVNLIDGLDGLAAGVCLIVCLTFFVVGWTQGHGVLMVLSACLGGAVLGFLLFNFHPASIFLGDSGSLLLGFLVAALSMLEASAATSCGRQLVPVVALGVPLLDTALAIVRRWSRKVPIWAADRQHLHHALMALGLGHRRAVLVLYGACAALGAAAVLMTMERAAAPLAAVGVAGLVAYACVRLAGGARLAAVWGRLCEEMTHRQRAARATIAVEEVAARMRAAECAHELWDAVGAALPTLDVDCATLCVYGRNGSPSLLLTWPKGQAEAMARLGVQPDTWSARLSLRRNGTVFGELRVGKSVERGPLLAEAPELLERVRRELSAQVERVSRACGAPAPCPAATAPRRDTGRLPVPPTVVRHFGHQVGLS